MAFKETLNKSASAVLSGAKKVLHTFRYSRLALFAVSLIIGAALTILFSEITLAYNVEYDGAIVAQIKNKAQYSDAEKIAEGMLYGGDFKDYAVSPKFHITFTTKKNLDDCSNVATKIIEQTKTISKGTAVKIDGETVACVSKDALIEDYIKSYLDNYVVGGEVTSQFVQNVECVNGYYPTNIFLDTNAVKDKLSALDVKTVQTIRIQEAIPYTTVTRKSDSRVLGDVQTVVKGANGVKEKVETVEMLNGVAVNTTVHSENIILNPVQEVIVVGTKRDTSVNNTYVSQLNCIWPLKRVSNQVITAYWGDGRNHKGIDIASPAGTPIYAAQTGTVVTSRYSSSYGYYVVIDHGNGYKTLYAHCSKLLVSVGESVAQGEVIAQVGTTGISTGNHLHFEVQKDGVKLNPAAFIGL